MEVGQESSVSGSQIAHRRSLNFEGGEDVKPDSGRKSKRQGERRWER